MIGFALAIPLALGCGSGGDGDEQANADDKEKNQDDKAKPEPKNKTPKVAAQPAGKQGYWFDEKGRRMFGRVPVNIFFDNPLVAMSDTTPVGPNGTKDPPGNGVTKPDPMNNGMGTDPKPVPTPKDPPKTTAGASDWKNLITKSILEDEMNAQVNGLRADLASVRTYNDAFRAKRFTIRAATVGALASIGDRHPETVRWKEKAKLLMALGAKIDESATEAGRKGRDPTVIHFEKIGEIMSGSTPSGVEPPEKDADISDYASRTGLMKRMSEGFSWMHKNIKDADRFSKESEKVDREAAIIGAFSQMIMDESYVFADEEKYKTEAQGMITAAVKIRDAVAGKDFNTFRAQLDWIQKRCNDCHNEYVGGQ